jgi:hypothetical protein
MNKYWRRAQNISIAVASLVAGLIIFPATALAGFGIDPGKVQIDNLYPGAEAEFTIKVYNQNDYDSTFTIFPRSPDYTETNYEVFPYFNWIVITPNEVKVAPQDNTEVRVLVTMPEDSDYFNRRSEVWISLTEKNNSDMVQIEIIARLFVNTSDSTPKKKADNELTEYSPDSTETSFQAVRESETQFTGKSITTPDSSGGISPWVIFGCVTGALVISEGTYLIVKKRRKKIQG